jgi:hypothetical protein
MTTIRLAVNGKFRQEVITLKQCEECPPPLLVSFFYLRHVDPIFKDIHYRDWVMDSGAFSAATTRKVIDINEYIDCCLKRKEEDPSLKEVFSLDVIGDHEASLKNWQKMEDAGVRAIPTFHYGTDINAIKDMPKTEKIALGGMVGQNKKEKIKFAEQCFARTWPKKIHGFGVTSEAILSRVPFHSVDASSWSYSPGRFGRWRSMPGFVSERSTSKNLKKEVQWYISLEKKMKNLWKKELNRLEKKG